MTVDVNRDAMPTVQEILERDEGAAAPAPYRETSTKSFGTEPISVDRYLSADFQRREYDRLWSRVWQWACNQEDIPEVGDHLVYEIGDRSVLIVRVAVDEIKAYHNACLHRGRQLKTAAGNSGQLVCGFHGWTWNLDGSLARIPCRWDFPQVKDESEFRLPEVRCESWSQFVFVNFDDEAAPLGECLDILPDHFSHFPLDDKFTAAWVQKVLPVNWKVVLEAFLESYHVILTHPQVLEWSGDANTQYDVWETSSRLLTPVGVASPHLGEIDDQVVYGAAADFFLPPEADPAASQLPPGRTARKGVADLTREMMKQAMGLDLSEASTTEVIDMAQYFLFPNWCPWSGVTNALQYRFRPNGDDPGSSIFDVRLMLPVPPGAPRPPAAKTHVLAPEESWENAPELMGFAGVLDQDESNLRTVQRGLRATVKPGLNFSDYQESRIRHFHQLLDSYLES